MKNVLKAIWQFCSYLFWPQWGKNKQRWHAGHETVGYE